MDVEKKAYLIIKTKKTRKRVKDNSNVVKLKKD